MEQQTCAPEIEKYIVATYNIKNEIFKWPKSGMAYQVQFVGTGGVAAISLTVNAPV
jgi:hypothetical protein